MKRRKMLLMFLLITGCIFLSSNVFAAWTQAKGHAYNQLTLSYFKTTSKMTTLVTEEGTVVRTNASARKNKEEEFTATKLSYYGEYGLLNNLTVILSGGWDYLRSNDILDNTDSKDSARGVGDIIFGVRQKISDNLGGGVLMSVQADLKIPEAYDYKNPVTHQNLGDGQYDLAVNLLFGRGFNWGYAVLATGYKFRFENDQLDPYTFKPSDQFNFSLSGGYNATSWLSIRGKLDWNKTIGNARVSSDFVDFAACCGINRSNGKAVMILDTLGLEQSTVSAGVSLAINITPKTQTVISYNIDLQGFGDVFITENASLGETISIAFVYMM
jgi:hypothetical protein